MRRYSNTIDGPASRYAVEQPEPEGSLFAPPREIQIPKRRGHVPIADTSKAARPRAAASADRAAKLLREVHARGTATCDEIASAWAVPVHTMSGRFTEMLSRGLVERTGAKRPTRSGSMASVLMLTAAGLAALQSAGRRSDPGGHAP